MRTKGFTLAELLVAVFILGVISSFTIPKVLTAQQSQHYKAVTKEAAATISQAYSTYKMTNTVTNSTSLNDIVGSLNYVKLDTSSWLDGDPSNGLGFFACGGVNKCYQLASGAVIMWDNGGTLGGTTPTSAMYFTIDPNYSKYEPTKKAQGFWLYLNGRLSTPQDITGTACNADGCWPPASDTDWFNWN